MKPEMLRCPVFGPTHRWTGPKEMRIEVAEDGREYDLLRLRCGCGAASIIMTPVKPTDIVADAHLDRWLRRR